MASIVMMNYYDPFQNICTNTVPYVQTFNQRLAKDVSGFGIIVDVFSAFDGKICTYTWMDVYSSSSGPGYSSQRPGVHRHR